LQYLYLSADLSVLLLVLAEFLIRVFLVAIFVFVVSGIKMEIDPIADISI